MPTRPDRSPLLALGVACLAVSAFTLVLGVTSALRYGWRTDTLTTLVRALPVPAARVDGRTVTFRAWDDLRAAQQTYQNRLAAVQGLSAPSAEEIGRQALDAAVRLTATESLARRYGVTVTDTEVQQQLQRSIDLAADPATLERVVREYYGWDVATLIRVVIEPYLLRSKVDDAIAADPTLGEDPQAKATRVRSLLAAEGADFAQIARQESEDPPTRANGGATLITRSTFEDDTVTAMLYALGEGGLSEPFTVGSSYYIVRVERVLTDDTSGEEVLQARAVIVRQRTVDTETAALLAADPPRLYLAPYAWSTVDGCVVSPTHGCSTE